MKRSRRYIFVRSANIPSYVCAAHPYRWNSALGHPFRCRWSDLLFPENVRGILAPRPVSHLKTLRLHRCDLRHRGRDRGFYPLGQSLVTIHDFYSGSGPEKRSCKAARAALASGALRALSGKLHKRYCSRLWFYEPGRRKECFSFRPRFGRDRSLRQVRSPDQSGG